MLKKILTPLFMRLQPLPETREQPSLYKKILLPLDGSVLAAEALPYTIAQAQQFGVKIILLKVIPPLLEARSPQMEALAAAEVEQELTPAVSTVSAAGVAVEIVSIEGGGGTGLAPKIVRQDSYRQSS